MADNNTGKTAKKNGQSIGDKIGAWWKGLKAEYNKIIWENKETVGKQTVAVVIITVILGVVIAIVDYILKYGIDILTSL